MPAHPDFDIEARMPVVGQDEDWAEVVLVLSRNGGRPTVLQFTRAAGELTIDALHEVLHPYAGRSISEIIWDKLAEVTRRLVGKDYGDDNKEVWAARAQTLTWVIAVHRNPYDPMAAYEAVREEIVERIDAN